MISKFYHNHIYSNSCINANNVDPDQTRSVASDLGLHCLPTSVVSYASFVLSLFVPHLSFFWCFVRVVLRDYGISRVSSLIL